jgi:cysteine dioxygenase
MNCIESVEELIETLNVSEPEDYVKVAKDMNIPKSDFKKYTFYKPDGYSRNCIERTSDYELLLLCWNPGDETPIHGHDEQRCWVYQVDGVIRELRYRENDDDEMEKCNRLELTPGHLTYMEDTMGYHSLKNCSNERAMTLHLYISPIDMCKTFDETEGTFIDKELEYDSYKGVLNKEFTSY